MRRIRLASSWQGVAGAVVEISASGAEVAFALYRVGCLSCLMSAQQRAGDSPAVVHRVLSALHVWHLFFGELKRQGARTRRCERTQRRTWHTLTVSLHSWRPCHTLQPSSPINSAAQRWRRPAWWAA